MLRGATVVACAAVIIGTSACSTSAPTAPTPASSSLSLGTVTRWSELASAARAITWSTSLPVAAADAPSGLAYTQTGDTIRLTWNAPADLVTSYVIEAGTSAGATNVIVVDTGGTQTSLTVLTVPVGTYFVRIRARNGNTLSAPSNEITIVVGGPPPCAGLPGAPSGLAASVTGSTVRLTWAAPATGCPPTTYQIEAGSSSGASNFGAFPTGSTNTSFTINNAPAGTYYLRLRAVTSAGLGPASNEVVITIAATGGYSGTFSGQVTITVSSSGGPDPTPVVCRFTFTLAGTLNVTLSASGSGGIANGQGTRTQIARTGPSGCSNDGPGADVLNFQNLPVTVNGSNLSFSYQQTDTTTSWRTATTTLSFGGSVSAGTVSGTVTYTHQGGGVAPNGPTTVTESGSATLPVTLR